MNVLLAPDVYVNASVALGSPPERVVQRVLGRAKTRQVTGEWVLGRVRFMLSALPEFKRDAVEQQLSLIRSLVQVLDDPGSFGPADWEPALVAIAKRAGVNRVVTDHPDLLSREQSDGVEFVSSEAYLVELMTPPPAPG